MSQNYLPKKGTRPEVPATEKIKLTPELGVYTFIDKDGNVKQIEKEKKTNTKYYPNTPSKVEIIVEEYAVIGISDTVAMGIGDQTMAYAEYVK